MTGPDPRTTWPDVLTTLLAGEDLDAHRAGWAMDEIMSGNATAVQVAGFLVALRSKGETIDELRAVADTMLAHAHRIEVPGDCMDIVGTGGDRANTVNISTMAAMVVAAAGVTIVKHGNRAASSKSGTADCLEALGIDLSVGPERVAEVAQRAGITFCFAQLFHPSMRHAAVPRAELGIPTLFNVLGPLTNPAQPRYAAVGVARADMAPLVAGVFAARGKRTAVFRGDDGLDEVTVSTTSRVWWASGEAGDSVREFVVDPERLGVSPAPLLSLRGGDGRHNAGVVLDVFGGATGPIRDAVVLNAAVALAVASGDPVTDQDEFTAALERGMVRAAEAIDSGAASATLARWRDVSTQAASR
ncbi:anthranilate phosphoribosyltransferase [Agilicoccus flavus]|uniref:anthranilate phosphoribosyltransferase n=1 Tax=Agilicoccus flavus TaxID=2775968 RepID=UPI001CF612B4|nr:anthranilate phosphoribosyltransferase [Agilicoccus flavus]